MKFSTRTTYGLRALVYLARNYSRNENIPLSQIAKNENLSPAYLERLFALLKKGEIIVSEKGKEGGYRLSADPKKISVLSIVKILEGDIVPFHCMDKNGKIKCSAKGKCGASEVLSGVYVAILKTLSGMRLSDLVS
jgi:Rrf2 family protein